MDNVSASEVNWRERLAALRTQLAPAGVDAVLVPRADEHLGEYVPACAERLAWLTGFTGSAGLAAVLADRAAVWSDGRYTLQLAQESDGAVWERLHLTEQPPAKWLAAARPGARVGYDPWLISEEGLRPFADAGLVMVPLAHNPVDAVWADRPAPPCSPARRQELAYAGEASADKRERLARELRDAGLHAAIITDPASIAWLLNIRGADVPYTPFMLGFAILDERADVRLFTDPAKITAEIVPWLGNHVSIAPTRELPASLAALSGRRVGVDLGGSPAWFAAQLREAGAQVVAAADPCLGARARKNGAEQDGARRAQTRDGAAMAQFLFWLSTIGEGETELSVGARLLALRGRQDLFRGESFPPIVGAGEHGAIIHYRPTASTNRPVRHGELLLVDSGGQYLDGTTDITRTVWIGSGAAPDVLRDRYTRALKGHIAIARLIFPDGTPGVRLDGFARAALWRAGLDYDHGTGHGVGSYLSVHEGPVSLSPYLRPAGFAEGMIVSNEPGYYEPGAFGIRLENLLLTRRADIGGVRPFLSFETLTLAPFDRAAIAHDLLEPDERAWLDAYHARVDKVLAPLVDADTGAWLHRACAPL